MRVSAGLRRDIIRRTEIGEKMIGLLSANTSFTGENNMDEEPAQTDLVRSISASINELQARIEATAGGIFRAKAATV
jgi:hypothetical protein